MKDRDQSRSLKEMLKTDLDQAFARAPKVDYADIVHKASQSPTFQETKQETEQKTKTKQFWLSALPLTAAAAIFALVAGLWIPGYQKEQAISQANSAFVEELFSAEGIQDSPRVNSSWFDLEDSLF